jgi:hypothetical protein
MHECSHAISLQSRCFLSSARHGLHFGEGWALCGRTSFEEENDMHSSPTIHTTENPFPLHPRQLGQEGLTASSMAIYAFSSSSLCLYMC